MAKNSGYQHGQFVAEGMTGTGMGTATSLASSKTSAPLLEWNGATQDPFVNHRRSG